MTDNETKFVKADNAGQNSTANGTSKVQIKAVDPAVVRAQQEKARARNSSTRQSNQNRQSSPSQNNQSRQTANSGFGIPKNSVPKGKAMPKDPAAFVSSMPKKQAPVGTPMPKKQAPVGTPMPKKQAPVGIAMPKSSVPADSTAVEQKKETEDSIIIPAEDNDVKVTASVQVQTGENDKLPAEDAKLSQTPVSEAAAPGPADETVSVRKVIVKKSAEEIAAEKSIKDEAAKEVKAAKKTDNKITKKSKPADKTEKTAQNKKTPAATAADSQPVNKKEPSGQNIEAKKEEKPHVNYESFVPSFKVVVKRTAAEEKEIEEKRKAELLAKKQLSAKEMKEKREANKKANENRKPKEFIGRKSSGNSSSETVSPRTKSSSIKGNKLVAFTAPSGGSQNGGKPKDRNERKNNKDKERDKFGSKFNETPEDLVKKNKNKHSKYKETKPIEKEEISQEVAEAIATGGVVINVPITLAGFCEQVEKPTSAAIMALMKMGIMANINQNLDEETAVLLGMELGVTVAVKKVEEIPVEEGIDRTEDREGDLVSRAPVITVMGHVDHGKTSILDAIRKTNVTAGEAGGITQAIGASEVIHNGQRIVFLDTPGHEAFTAMRARGAHITDIAVLVVAADDSVKPQTIESISHAKAAGVPIIVAINKIDKPSANLDIVKKDLADNGVLVEEWGGNTIAVPVSAKTGQNIDLLLEMILLQAEMLELKANPDRLAMGTVIEARLDKNLGPVATLLVMNGTLQAGAAVVAGTACGRVRTMKSDKGVSLKKAIPATAVEITGLTEVPESGDEFFMVRDDKTAKEIAARRAEKLRADLMAKSSAVSLEKLFSQIEDGEVKDLNIIIKADVQGSVEALQSSLEKLKNENVRVNIIHTGVGTVTEGDVMLAGTSNALIIGFNVRPSSAVSAQAESQNVEIRCYRIIYEVIDDIEAAMKGMLNPVFKECILGKVEVRTTFKVPNVGIIAGCYVTEGKVSRNAQLRLVRDGIVVHEGVVSSLKRFKDDAKEVLTGFECGLGIKDYNDIKEGDIIEAFEMQEVKRD